MDAAGDYLINFQKLGIALALGLLIGLERGWAERAAVEGSRVAGIRTFGLISLLGALWQLLGASAGPLLLGIAFLAFTLLVISVSFLEAKRKREYGITTSVAALVAFAVGALAMGEYATLAAAATVLVVILLGLKPVLHGWLSHLEPYELSATFKLLLISVVMLPILPDRTYDPWDAFNPYEIWWMVVLVSAISFSGYFAVKIAGARRGIVMTGVFGGLASSTAVALSLSRVGKQEPDLHAVLNAGILVSAATMFPRVLLVVGVIHPALLQRLSWPMLAMSGVGYLAVWGLVRRGLKASTVDTVKLRNPFEFMVALQFGALLGMIMLLTRVLQEWLGSAGIYLLASVSGISDVDAITLSLSRMALNGKTSLDLAANGIVLASMVNTLIKGLMVVFIARGRMAWEAALLFSLMILAGGLVIGVRAFTGW